MTENSLQYFEDLKTAGSLSRLELEVFAAFVDIGPVHNLRLLEYLQQKEAVNKRKADRIEWTRSNAWPRVTDLTRKGHLDDLGAFRVPWGGKTKTLHVRQVKYGAGVVDTAWEKVKKPVSNGRLPFSSKQIKPAAESARCKASQAGRDLQECRKRGKNINKQQLTFDFNRGENKL